MDALSNSKDYAVGQDDIHYQMRKHLHSETRSTLLSVLNEILIAGNFPCSWRESHVVRIQKPRKHTINPTNYRPIALTSCVCKIMECMINNRLVWYLAKNKIITPAQSGFRRPACTFRVFCQRGFYSEAASYCYFLRSRKGL